LGYICTRVKLTNLCFGTVADFMTLKFGGLNDGNKKKLEKFLPISDKLTLFFLSFFLVACPMMTKFWSKLFAVFSHLAIWPLFTTTQIQAAALFPLANAFFVHPRSRKLPPPLNCVWNVQVHAQKSDFVFLRNGRVHLNRQGRHFSRLLATQVCASTIVMLDTPHSEVVWRVLATHSILQFPLHFPARASPFA
jgi:hypothetical protein